MDVERENLNQHFPNNRRVMLQNHGGQRPVLGARWTKIPRGPSEPRPGWAPRPDGGRPERRPELGFGVNRRRTPSMTQEGRSPAPGFQLQGRARLAFLRMLRPGWCPQQSEGGHGDEVQLLLGSLTSGRIVKTCIHATLIFHRNLLFMC